MPERTGLSPTSLLSRWLVGMGLISWRYLWATTPLHRSQTRSERAQTPPPLPADLPAENLQPWEAGVGPLYHRVFAIHVVEASKDAEAVMATVSGDLGRLVPSEVVQVHEGGASDRRLRPGDRLVVDMPGPWNGPVRVAAVERCRLQLATLRGHLEAGQIDFRAWDVDDGVIFEIESWARSATRTVDVLYSHLRLAKEIQLNMWVRFCLAVATDAGGRPARGVEIRTEVCPV
ncbi:MAG: DUF1990 family protein [Marmoricola sp.]